MTTAEAGGRYAPDNVGAIWITDGGGRFVKTLNVWAKRRRKYLERWIADTSAAGLRQNLVDAVSTASRSGHGTHLARWNCTDASRNVVPDGSYHVCFELTDDNRAGPVDCVRFDKGSTPSTVTPPDLPTFTRRTIELTP